MHLIKLIPAACRLRSAGFCLCAVALAAPAGCMQDGTWNNRVYSGHRQEKLVDPGARSDIIGVRKFFSADPWLSFNSDGSNRVDGVKFALYLESATAPKGVFGTGAIFVTMYRIDYDINGQEKPVPIYEWELPQEKAYYWRAKRETAFGWGYGLRLPWDPNLNIAGRLVAFVVKYVREDGRVISSSRQIDRVPSTGTPLPNIAGRAYSTDSLSGNSTSVGNSSAAKSSPAAAGGGFTDSIDQTQGVSASSANASPSAIQAPSSPYGGRPLAPIRPALSRPMGRTDLTQSTGAPGGATAQTGGRIAGVPEAASAQPARPPAAGRYTVTVTTDPPPRKTYQPRGDTTEK